jgi:hypothetical protein
LIVLHRVDENGAIKYISPEKFNAALIL